MSLLQSPLTGSGPTRRQRSSATRTGINPNRVELNPIKAVLNPIKAALKPIRADLNPNRAALSPTRDIDGLTALPGREVKTTRPVVAKTVSRGDKRSSVRTTANRSHGEDTKSTTRTIVRM